MKNKTLTMKKFRRILYFNNKEKTRDDKKTFYMYC